MHGGDPGTGKDVRGIGLVQGEDLRVQFIAVPVPDGKFGSFAVVRGVIQSPGLVKGPHQIGAARGVCNGAGLQRSLRIIDRRSGGIRISLVGRLG